MFYIFRLSPFPMASSASLTRPRADLFILDEQLIVRRFGPLRPGLIQCARGHEMDVDGGTFGGAFQCPHHFSDRQRCTAYAYVVRLTEQHYLLLDLNREEATFIRRANHGRGLDLASVIAHFGLDDFRRSDL